MSALLEFVALRRRAQARAVHDSSPKLRPQVCITHGLLKSIVCVGFVRPLFKCIVKEIVSL